MSIFREGRTLVEMQDRLIELLVQKAWADEAGNADRARALRTEIDQATAEYRNARRGLDADSDRPQRAVEPRSALRARSVQGRR